MSLFGVYPFEVFVANLFGPKSGITVKVKHFHHPTYYEDGKYISEPVTGENGSISIPYGRRFGFPMYFGDESLEISISGTPGNTYYIQAGAKAKCYPEQLENANFTPTSFGSDVDDDSITFYKGGLWEIDPNTTTPTWTMTIKKYTVDPETDNVTVGENPPG